MNLELIIILSGGDEIFDERKQIVSIFLARKLNEE
jgi:hypothetical protein